MLINSMANNSSTMSTMCRNNNSCVSMEERLAKCEGHLQEKMEEVKTLQKEVIKLF